MHFKERDWDDMHGDEIFNISWLGTIAGDDYWENINDEFDNADLDAPDAFNNQIAERTDGPGHPLDCNFEPGTCRPQCPTAVWYKRRKQVQFSWEEDIEGCEFQPLSTYIMLTPLINGELPDDIIEDYTAIVLPMTRPKPDPVKVYKNQIFEDNPHVKLEEGVEYYVSALYLKDIG